VEPCEEPLRCDVKDARSMEGLERGLQLSSVEARGLHVVFSTILRNMDILVAKREGLRPIRYLDYNLDDIEAKMNFIPDISKFSNILKDKTEKKLNWHKMVSEKPH